MSDLIERLKKHEHCLGPGCENAQLIWDAIERIALLEKVAAMAITVSGNTSPLRDDNIELAAALRAAGYLED